MTVARPRVVFALSEELSAGALEEESITVRDRNGVRQAGTVSWDPEHWWVVWEPERDLPPGEELTVRLDAGSVENLDGVELGEDVVFTFRSAGQGPEIPEPAGTSITTR